MDREEAISILACNAVNATGALGCLHPKAKKASCLNQQIEALNMAIEALQEPERKKGRWIEIIKDERFGDEWDEIAIYKCSVCESEFVECMGTYNFCPNCGADMRGEEE